MLRFIRFTLRWPGSPLRLEVLGARRLPRMKRATWKGRNPRPGLAVCMLSQTAVAAATTVTGSAVVPVTLKCRQFQNQSRYSWHCSHGESVILYGDITSNVLHFAASQSPRRLTLGYRTVLRFGVTANLCLRRLRDPASDYCSLVDVALYRILAVMIMPPFVCVYVCMFHMYVCSICMYVSMCIMRARSDTNTWPTRSQARIRT